MSQSSLTLLWGFCSQRERAGSTGRWEQGGAAAGGGDGRREGSGRRGGHVRRGAAGVAGLCGVAVCGAGRWRERNRAARAGRDHGEQLTAAV